MISTHARRCFHQALMQLSHYDTSIIKNIIIKYNATFMRTVETKNIDTMVASFLSALVSRNAHIEFAKTYFADDVELLCAIGVEEPLRFLSKEKRATLYSWLVDEKHKCYEPFKIAALRSSPRIAERIARDYRGDAGWDYIVDALPAGTETEEAFAELVVWLKAMSVPADMYSI